MQENELIVLEEVKYPVTQSDLESFVSTWAEVPKLDPLDEDKTQYKAVKSAHLQAVKFRTSIEKKRKELKAPALEYGKKVDAIAKEFQEIVHSKELELFSERNKVEQYEKEQEQKRLDAERERVEKIGKAITHLQMIPLDSMGKSCAELKEVYESIDMPNDEIYAERLDEAILVYKDTLNKLETAIDTAEKAEQAEAIQREAEERRVKEDEERIAKGKAEREVLDNERKAFEKEKEEHARIIREQQEEINRQNAEREAEELAKKQAEEEKARREQEEIDRQNAERENKANLDKKKDNCFNEIVSLMECECEVSVLIDAVIDNKITNIKWVD